MKQDTINLMPQPKEELLKIAKRFGIKVGCIVGGSVLAFFWLVIFPSVRFNSSFMFFSIFFPVMAAFCLGRFAYGYKGIKLKVISPRKLHICFEPDFSREHTTRINPGTGLPMAGGGHGVDVGGNSFGSSKL